MTARLLEKFQRWDALDNDPDLESGSLPLVLYLARRVYCDYEPNGVRPFLLQLTKWLDNLETEEDQKTLISLLSHLFFAGKGEFESLYRSTLTNIYRWLAELTTANIADPDIASTLNERLRRTWICPITDSLRINAFLKVNEIPGHDHRPHWRSLARFGDVDKIRDYMSIHSIERIVLLEDFIGSGTQIRPTVGFICENFPETQIALCPLIVCPKGNNILADLAVKYGQLTYLPTLILPDEVFLQPTPRAGELATFARGRTLINRIKQRLATDAFGFRDTGALVVMFSNCPDNTLAIFRDEATAWSPLFPRVRRPE